MRRVQSELNTDDSYEAGFGPPNKNTEWMGVTFWVFYVLAIFIAWTFFGVLLTFKFVPIPTKYAWTIVHVVHTVIQFQMMHWSKGSPFWIPADQGEYDSLTFWEQIDGGRQYTNNRKFLTIVPIILFLLATSNTNWEKNVLICNFACLALLLIAKLGVMHKVRIAGINK